jgi:hypothetical protein
MRLVTVIAFLFILPAYIHKEIRMNNGEVNKKPSQPRTGTEVLESIEQLLARTIAIPQQPPRKIESDETKELYEALATAQKAFSDVEKSGMIGGRNIPYAKIDDLTNASRAALRSQKLVSNSFTIMEQGLEVLVTRLVHTPTGQYIESRLPLLNNSEEQKRGASITYAWRYTYAPLIGLVDNSCDEDSVPRSAPTIFPIKK